MNRRSFVQVALVAVAGLFGIKTVEAAAPALVSWKRAWMCAWNGWHFQIDKQIDSYTKEVQKILTVTYGGRSVSAVLHGDKGDADVRRAVENIALFVIGDDLGQAYMLDHMRSPSGCVVDRFIKLLNECLMAKCWSKVPFMAEAGLATCVAWNESPIGRIFICGPSLAGIRTNFVPHDYEPPAFCEERLRLYRENVRICGS